MKPVKVMIVEDSILMQKIISDIFEDEMNFQIVGQAFSGKEALEKIEKLSPDIITLDVHLPDMDGLVVLKEIMDKNPTKVVMLSAYTQKGADITMKALELGAVDFIPKPSGEISLDFYKFKEIIISKFSLIAEVELNRYLDSFRGLSVIEGALDIRKLVIIAASTGGPRAVINIMQKLPADLNASFLIVQHMPKGFTKSFADSINWSSKIKTKEAEDNELVMKSAGYVAPANYHLVLDSLVTEKKKRFRLKLDETELVNYVRPSADVTMISAADLYGPNIIGVVLTGMGKDGLEGARKIKEKGGKIIAQDKQSSVVYGMPKAVIDAGLADCVTVLDNIADEIIKQVN